MQADTLDPEQAVSQTGKTNVTGLPYIVGSVTRRSSYLTQWCV